MCEQSNPNKEEHLQVEVAVMVHVLDQHPAPLRLSDLILELTGTRHEDARARKDDIEVAVEQLERKGLLFAQGECVLATPAARHFHSLPML